MCKLLSKVVANFDVVRINGGGARSDFSLKLRAEASGKVIEQLETDEAPALGVALLAGVAVGVFHDLEDGIKKTVRIKKTVTPDRKMVEKYSEPQLMYERLYKSLAPVREKWEI
jgi:xylulokinase